MISLMDLNPTRSAHPVERTDVLDGFFLDFAYELLMDLQACVKATDDEMVVGIKEHQLFTAQTIIESQYISCCFQHKENFTFVLSFSLIVNSLYAFDAVPLPLVTHSVLPPVCQPPSSSPLVLSLMHQRKER